jgi:tellurite resistance-related uncharacterized protein
VIEVERTITGFRLDALGEWIAELDCGHDQHIRHRPPFEIRPWIRSAKERLARLESKRDCPLCDRAVLPSRLDLLRRTPCWSEQSMPVALRGVHKLAEGNWAVLVVDEGVLVYRPARVRSASVALATGDQHVIPPGVEHSVEPKGAVSFHLEIYKVVVEPTEVDRDSREDGGEPRGL